MEQPQIISRRKTRRSPTIENKAKVIVWNDDITTFDFVVRMLTEIFFFEQEEALRLTIKIDRTGSGVAGIYSRDIAESKAEAATEMARTEGFPLRITTENA